MPQIILKPGKELSTKSQHHWIFSGAIGKLDAKDGDEVSVYSAKKEFLGHGIYKDRGSIAVRMYSFSEKTSIKEAIVARLKSAAELRSKLFDESITNAYRVIHSEGDGIPGLVVDKYADILVIQISTRGTDAYKQVIVDTLVSLFHPKGILEKSDGPSRKEEGLAPVVQTLYGEVPEGVAILENSMKLSVRFDGQKTGFFLDQREEREMVRKLSKGKRVGNIFSYSGGFSIAALVGGASHVDSIDVSGKAMDLVRTNTHLNGFSDDMSGYIIDDAFKFLREAPLNYDLLILDPPAFAKKRNDLENAIKGYREINATAMRKLPKGSFLLTASCSYFMDRELFQKTIFLAARDARRNVRILSHHHLASDHSVNLFHPEGDYLKSLLLYVE